MLSQKSVSFIQRSATAGKRFFLDLTSSAPHGPATPAPRHEALFAEATAPRTPSFNAEDVSDKPGYVRAAPLMTQSDIDTIDERYRDRIRSLQAADEMVAEIITTLQDTGTLSSTYIFFTSDNGYLLGQHRQTDKGVPYEEAIKVPLWSGAQGLRRAEASVSFRPASTWLRPSRTWLETQFPASFPAAPSFRCFKDRNPSLAERDDLAVLPRGQR